MNKFDQAMMLIVCFALGMALGHYQANQWDQQRKEVEICRTK